ncbi:hypothetical protein fugu_002712 [Takifugu bimaculatus]|uniref:Right handed beta helix domain-containing protein n=3 Tax=Takifugu TaxID=31032 RepID=A0A4Z2BDR3_9TELE|nr:hypothetical protein fugu_002712 [Takifugu bimaculatus]
MVEGLKLYDQLEMLTRKLHIIENPLLRYVLAYKGNSRQQCMQGRGPRESGMMVVHIVTASCNTLLLQSLLNDRLIPLCSAEDTEIQFHRDPVSAVDSCCQGDTVIILPGLYSVNNSIFLPDSITVEGFGLPDEVVIEKKDKGDSFIESTGADVRLSNIKFIQRDAIEGILCVRQGRLCMENCVLQCETTGVIVRTSAHLIMKMCDLYGSKGAGVEIYPGSVCTLIGNGIHHCKDGVLIKEFIDHLDMMPSITMENNVIHNNEGYGVIVVKPNNEERKASGDASEESKQISNGSTPIESNSAEKKDSTDDSVASTVGKKWQFNRQLNPNKEVTCVQAVQDLMGDHIFVSIQGNQFRRNGLSDFGTFFF